MTTLKDLVGSYERDRPLAEASTIPSGWYTDSRIFELERQTVFARSWHFACRTDQVAAPGQFVSLELAGEPLVVVRGQDAVIRGFFNVCRHHAAAVVTAEEGSASSLRCPYHGWTYGLDGALKGTPDFSEVCNFERSSSGLVPVATSIREPWVFVRLERTGASLDQYFSPDLIARLQGLNLDRLTWTERRRYSLACNWKVFVDNYQDGGYHVNTVHLGLAGALDYSQYRTDNFAHCGVQSSPIKPSDDPLVNKVRTGDFAYYWWIFPNLMVNLYQGVMDTNLVLPLGPDRCRVFFDFYFADTEGPAAQKFIADSMAVAHQVQLEDQEVCEEVQRGLKSRSYDTGRFSVKRESGGYHFHQLLAKALRAGA